MIFFPVVSDAIRPVTALIQLLTLGYYYITIPRVVMISTLLHSSAPFSLILTATVNTLADWDFLVLFSWVILCSSSGSMHDAAVCLFVIRHGLLWKLDNQAVLAASAITILLLMQQSQLVVQHTEWWAAFAVSYFLYSTKILKK